MLFPVIPHKISVPEKPERVKGGYRAAVWMVAVFYVIISAILFGFGKPILSLFMDDSATGEVLKVGLHFTWVVTPFYIMVALKVVTDSVMRGAGAMKQFMITTFFDLVLRVILAYLLSGWLGYSAFTGQSVSVDLEHAAFSLVLSQRYLAVKRNHINNVRGTNQIYDLFPDIIYNSLLS